MVLAFIVPLFATDNYSVASEKEPNPIIPSDIIFADPISITSDLELSAAASSGIGSSGDPYIIENLDINSIDFDGIYIYGTSSHFLIRNCTIITPNTYGIDIYNVATGTANVWNCSITAGISGIRVRNSNYPNIFNNTIDGCDTAGLELSGCYSADLYNNTIFDNHFGIYVIACYHSNIYYNYVYDNADDGIQVQDSDETVIQYNTCNNNVDGIEVYSCYDPFVGNNWLNDNELFGIYIRWSDYARVGGNNFHACGLGVYDGDKDKLLTLQVTSNYIDGSLIYYGENVTDENIWLRYSQFILVNCSNVQISSQDELSLSLYQAISLLFCEDIDVRFCFINDAFYGIDYLHSVEIKIYNNTIDGFNSAIICSNVTGGFIRENVLANGVTGVTFFDEVDNYSIYENNLKDLTGYGIQLLNSDDNEVFHNNFINAGVSASYGYDSGAGNYWYNITLLAGNYWSNWVAGSYAIDGPAGTFDMYPLSSPYVPPPIVPELMNLSWFLIILFSIVPAVLTYYKKRK